MASRQITKIDPRGDIIVVIPDAIEQIDTTESGIHLPDEAKPVVIDRFGEVVAIGPDAYRCEVGERIMFSAYAGTELEVGGQRVLYMNDSSVLAGVEIEG